MQPGRDVMECASALLSPVARILAVTACQYPWFHRPNREHFVGKSVSGKSEVE